MKGYRLVLVVLVRSYSYWFSCNDCNVVVVLARILLIWESWIDPSNCQLCVLPGQLRDERLLLNVVVVAFVVAVARTLRLKICRHSIYLYW